MKKIKIWGLDEAMPLAEFVEMRDKSILIMERICHNHYSEHCLFLLWVGLKIVYSHETHVAGLYIAHRNHLRLFGTNF